MKHVLVIHGPNLNLLGQRQSNIYGTTSLENINQSLQVIAQSEQYQLSCFQSQSEQALIERIHHAQTEQVNFIIINPAAFSHTSIAMRDALLAVAIPFIEVHLSNIFARESFRHHSYFSDVASGLITGLGPHGYTLALQAAIEQLENC